MTRNILTESNIHESIKDRIGGGHTETIHEVQQALENHKVVVVGMAQNPYCKKVRKQFDHAAINYNYLEYGSYFKEWQKRLTLKMWAGWPTFPMVFVKGQLIGGNQDVQSLLSSGTLEKMISQ